MRLVQICMTWWGSSRRASINVDVASLCSGKLRAVHMNKQHMDKRRPVLSA